MRKIGESRDCPAPVGTEQNGSYAIKNWAALAALAAAAFYLALSGAEVATQRSFIMIAIVRVMVDRPTLTFRTLTVAAFAVLLLAPEAIVHPSFQMSLAATLALVSYVDERWRRQSARGEDAPLQLALGGTRPRKSFCAVISLFKFSEKVRKPRWQGSFNGVLFTEALPDCVLNMA